MNYFVPALSNRVERLTRGFEGRSPSASDIGLYPPVDLY
jgi:hypothetical protein